MHKNLIAGLLAFATAALTSLPAPAQTPPLKVGFVYVSPVGDAGWSHQHDQGRRAMEAALGPRVASTVVEAVAEGADGERVMRELAASGHRLIFATSFGYLEGALRVAAEFPDVRIEHAGGYRTAPNVATYNARYFEARYLAGLIAGRTSRTGVAGYVAGFPVPEVIQGINAFAAGMREVQPSAQVRVLWLNAWFDPPRERDAALALVNAGADVLTNHSGSPAVAQAAQSVASRGVKFIAYQSDMAAYAPDAQLAAVTHHWGDHYTAAARAVLDGSWRSRATWGSMKDGYVRLSALRPDLDAATRALVERRRQDIESGRFKPFGTLSDAQIATMNTFGPGVAGTLPKP